LTIDEMRIELDKVICRSITGIQKSQKDAGTAVIINLLGQGLSASKNTGNLGKPTGKYISKTLAWLEIKTEKNLKPKP